MKKFVCKYFELFQKLSNLPCKHNCVAGTHWNSLALVDSQTSRSWTDKSRTLRSRTSRSPDIQVPGHPGPRTSRSFGHPGLSDFQVPGHPGPRTSKSFGHPGPRTSRSFGLPGLILNCQNVHQVMFPHQSVKVSQRSQVSRVALCMSKVEVL